MLKKQKKNKKQRFIYHDESLDSNIILSPKPTLENEIINPSSKIASHINTFIVLLPTLTVIFFSIAVTAFGLNFLGDIMSDEKIRNEKDIATLIATNEIKISDDFISIGHIESYNRVKKTFDSHPTKLITKNKDSFYIDALYKNVNPKSEIFINKISKYNTIACFKTVENIKCYRTFSYEKYKSNKE
jgi:hypothetical protein